MNLENYGIQEMNAQELISVDGGNIGRLLRRAAFVIGEFLIENREEIVSSGWDSTPYGHYGGARP